jgi:hypothetical protein
MQIVSLVFSTTLHFSRPDCVDCHLTISTSPSERRQKSAAACAPHGLCGCDETTQSNGAIQRKVRRARARRHDWRRRRGVVRGRERQRFILCFVFFLVVLVIIIILVVSIIIISLLCHLGRAVRRLARALDCRSAADRDCVRGFDRFGRASRRGGGRSRRCIGRAATRAHTAPRQRAAGGTWADGVGSGCVGLDKQ